MRRSSLHHVCVHQGRFVFSLVLSLVLSLAGLAGLAAHAEAQATLITGLGGRAGFGNNCLGMNDDGSSDTIPLDLPFPAGLRFFSATHTSLSVNTNGNITFSGPLPTFTPDAFPVASRPMIAPFWADVDTRTPGGFLGCNGPGDGEAVIGPACDNPSENGVWWYVEPGRMIFTWDRVGYYQCAIDHRMSFQLVLTAATGGCGGAGDFDVEFRFNRCEWETGDASGGTGGFGGTPAQSGFDAGDGTNFVEIMGSRAPGIADHLCRDSNVGETGIWRFQIRSGSVICPGAGEACMVPGQLGACAVGATNCVGSGTECVQQVFPGAERCDNLDNDCNGTPDDGEGLCSAGEVCSGGICVGACFEGSCAPGSECNASGVCVDPLCVGVTCPEGERCVGGMCRPACEGVVCPAGRSCVAGRCVDVCSGLTCDDCTTCVDGACVIRCDMGGTCRAGQTCSAAGRCEDSACSGVVCDPGTYCRGGVCADACEGVICPTREFCVVGECVPIDRPDTGPARDGGGGMGGDAGGGGRTARTSCACSVGAQPSGLGTALLAGLALALAMRRARRSRVRG